MLQGELQSCKVSLEEKEPASCDFSRSFEVYPTVHLNQFIMGPDVEIKLWLGTVNSVNCVARFISSFGDVSVEYIWDGHSDTVTLGHGVVGFGLHCGNLAP